MGTASASSACTDTMRTSTGAASRPVTAAAGSSRTTTTPTLSLVPCIGSPGVTIVATERDGRRHHRDRRAARPRPPGRPPRRLDGWPPGRRRSSRSTPVTETAGPPAPAPGSTRWAAIRSGPAANTTAPRSRRPVSATPRSSCHAFEGVARRLAPRLVGPERAGGAVAHGDEVLLQLGDVGTGGRVGALADRAPHRAAAEEQRHRIAVHLAERRRPVRPRCRPRAGR